MGRISWSPISAEELLHKNQLEKKETFVSIKLATYYI